MPIDEEDRLRVLRSYAVLDTPPAEALDRITALARVIFDAPIALISLVDDHRQWFKSRQGLDACETGRDQAFCAYALPLERGGVLIVGDATQDPRFQGNPLVTGAPGIRFYAGAVLTSSERANLGTLCVIDTRPRADITPVQIQTLQALADLVIGELEVQRARREDEAKRRLLDLAETMSGVGRWRLEVASGSIEWSDEVYRIHGVDPASFDPMLDSALDFYDEAGRKTVTDCLAAAVDQGRGYSHQLQIRRRDGEWRQVACKAACEIGASGAVVAVSGVFQDVTDQQALLAKVRADGERYKLLTQNATDAIVTYRPEGIFTYLSPAVEVLIGRTPAELIGTSTYDLVHPDDRERITSEFRSLLTQGAASARIEYRALCRDGGHVWVEAHPSPMFDAQGKLTGFQDVVRDISARKEMEVELEAARCAAEAAARAKADFLANMSHELRTPLTSILGYTSLAVEQPELRPLTRDYLRRIENASKALLSTVNDILDFSKLEAGQVTLRPAPTDVLAVCQGALELFTPQAAAKDVELRIDAPATPLPLLLLDAERLLQLLLNLIGNAVKFTDEGSVVVAIDLSGDRLTLKVSDTGAGIPEEAVGHLFKRFSQIDGSSTRNHGGTGLGLAICKGLAERMGGTIAVRSQVGRGSTFTLELPADAAPAALASPAPASVEAVVQDLEALRVLVVDDHPANRELARLVLLGAGAVVTEAASGTEALEALSEAAFDVVLLDLRMPDVDGAEVLARLRKMPGPNEGVPVIAYTADAPPSVPSQGPTFDGYVGKPINPANLLQTIWRAAMWRAADGEIARAG